MTAIQQLSRYWARIALAVLILLGSIGTAHCRQPPPDKAAVKADLQRILNEPEFRPETSEPSAFSNAIDAIHKAWDRFTAWVKRLFGSRDEPPKEREAYSADNILLRILMPILILLLVVVAAILIVQAIRGRGARPKKAVTTSDFDIDSAQADMVSEPDVWLSRARTLAQSGDFRRALRAVFLGAILELDRAGAFRIERGRTNGEYLRILRSTNLATYYGALDPMVSDFDPRWYGGFATTEADYSTAVSRYEGLKRLTLEAANSRDPKIARSAR